MKLRIIGRLSLAACSILFCCSMAEAADAPATQPARVVVRPADTGAALINPGMGWILFYYDNGLPRYGSRLAADDTVDDFPGLSAIYLRLGWAFLEPEEGKFHWTVVDTPAQRWIAKGKKIVLRLTCSESGMEYATPRWVEQAGAKGHRFSYGKGVVPDGRCWEPDYDDPIFLAKLDNFLAAAAKRYDGDPNVAHIDVGSFGVWGEGHTYASTRLPYSTATLQRHIDLHLKHFKRTLLVANDDFVLHDRGPASIDYAREKGLTLRDDSILVQAGDNAYFHAAMAKDFWPRLPVILESEHYGPSRDRGNWKDGSKYLQAVEEYHASYAGIHWWPREFLNENRQLIEKINLRLGYRLQLIEASWPATVRPGEPFTIATGWRNAGVAPCLPGGYPAVTLKDEKGGIAGVFVNEGFDMRRLEVGPPGQARTASQEASFTLPPGIRSGDYRVYISVGSRIGTPAIALPLADGDGALRYLVGRLAVAAP